MRCKKYENAVDQFDRGVAFSTANRFEVSQEFRNVCASLFCNKSECLKELVCNAMYDLERTGM